ncbi:MAG: hypothetical protein K1X39_07905 [Thermoflexales bacterium]|nr:hypothetical protein [Thermoflexales bacterium]
MFVNCLLFCALVLASCDQLGHGSRVECADVFNEFESGFPFDIVSTSERSQWIIKNYDVPASAIRESGPWLYWSEGATDYSFTTDGPRVIKSWARRFTVRDVLRCLGDPDVYQAFREPDVYRLILWYPKRAVSFEAAYFTNATLSASPFKLDSDIRTSTVVQPADLASMLDDATPNINWAHLRDVTLMRPWPGDIQKIAIIEARFGNK